MPYAVTHILVPIILVALFRDLYLKTGDKKHFPLHYVLLAGLGGVLPDIDIPISMLFNFLGFESVNFHKTFTHSLSFALMFIIFYLILNPVKTEAKICNLTRHKLKLSVIFLMIAIGITCHLFLDSFTSEWTYLLYPFSANAFGFDLLQYLPPNWQASFLPLLDGIFLVIWIIYLELKHKISDFI